VPAVMEITQMKNMIPVFKEFTGGHKTGRK
jgi:hypothetical protein